MKKTVLTICACGRKEGWFIPQCRWLSFVILLIGFLPVNAQKQQVDLHLKNVSLVDVLMAIEHASTYSFVFKMEDVERVNNLTVRSSNRSVKEILDSCLMNTGLGYDLENNLIVIKRMEQAAIPLLVSGKVVNRVGEPLPGVTILIKGTTWGAVTDVDGNFKISFFDNQDVVFVFSFIGMKSKEVTYNGQKELSVVLEEDVVTMNEVVVTGYQVIDRKKLTSSVTSVKAEDIMIPGATSIDQMLKGRVPDMMLVTNSGEVGVVPRIRIRGTSTLIGNREPLWVVDGIVVNDPVPISPEELNDPDYINRIGNAIAGLNPQDIDRIDVLKDASATALYGQKLRMVSLSLPPKKVRLGIFLYGTTLQGVLNCVPGTPIARLMSWILKKEWIFQEDWWLRIMFFLLE